MNAGQVVIWGGVALVLLLILVDLRIMRKIRRERAALESARRPKVQKGRLYTALMVAKRGWDFAAMSRLLVAESKPEALGMAYEEVIRGYPKAEGWGGHACTVSAVPQDFLDSAAGHVGAHDKSAAVLQPRGQVLA